MTDEEIKRVIRFVADEAWEIAMEGGSPPEVARRIENLSDDQERCAALVASIKSDVAVGQLTRDSSDAV